eukprot:NODE_244_length_11882_cov_0.560214.p2 type:complete len:366 gc:universal NODE_244_length_11882_cov_0.560214:9933-11030(+)
MLTIVRKFHDPKKTAEILKKHYIQRTTDEKKYLREYEANEWLHNEGKQYFWGDARRFLPNKDKNPRQPFPQNPDFLVQDPIGDKLKEDIFQRFINKSDPLSAEKLAEVYQLSLDRVKAIIKLKWLERGMKEKGIALQGHYQACMDKLLNAKNDITRENRETKMKYYKKREFPIFVPSKSPNPTPEEAASAMHTDPFIKQIQKINKAASRPLKIPKFLSDMYCPTSASPNWKPEISNTKELKTNFTSDKLVRRSITNSNVNAKNPSYSYPGTLQAESSQPIFESGKAWKRQPRHPVVFVDISKSKADPKIKWNPISQMEHVTPSPQSGAIIVRDSNGKLRSPNASELRTRELWGRKIASQKMYKNF